MRRFAILLYPDFSLQEITSLTSALAIWFGEKIDFIASGNREYVSEEGFRILPTRTTAEAKITDYDCVILPGTINPLPALFDEALIDFLKSGIGIQMLFLQLSHLLRFCCPRRESLAAGNLLLVILCRWRMFFRLWKSTTSYTKQ